MWVVQISQYCVNRRATRRFVNFNEETCGCFIRVYGASAPCKLSPAFGMLHQRCRRTSFGILNHKFACWHVIPNKTASMTAHKATHTLPESSVSTWLDLCSHDSWRQTKQLSCLQVRIISRHATKSHRDSCRKKVPTTFPFPSCDSDSSTPQHEKNLRWSLIAF